MAKAVLVLKVVLMVKVVPVLMVEVFLAVKMVLMGVVEELWLPGKAILVEPLMVETFPMTCLFLLEPGLALQEDRSHL